MAGEKSKLKPGHTVYAGGPWGGVPVRTELPNHKFDGTFDRSGKLTKKKVELPPLQHDLPPRIPIDPTKFIRHAEVKGNKTRKGEPVPVTVVLWRGYYQMKEDRYQWINDKMLKMMRAIYDPTTETWSEHVETASSLQTQPPN